MYAVNFSVIGYFKSFFLLALIEIHRCALLMNMHLLSENVITTSHWLIRGTQSTLTTSPLFHVE